MKTKIRRALSLLMALAIVCSLTVLPASAAGALSLEIRGTLSDDGKTYAADLYVTGVEKANAYNATLTYDADVLEIVEAPAEIGNGFMASVNDQTAGTVQFGGMSMNNVTPGGGELLIGRVTLRIKNGVEGQVPTAVSAEVTTFADVEQTDYTLPDEASETVTVQGVAPAVTTLELEKGVVEVDGKTDVNLTVTAKKSDGTEVVLGNGELKVSPANKGVSYSGGKVVVAKDAEADTYTFTVDNDNDASTGKATLTVTRLGAGEIVEVEISGDKTIKISSGSAAYSAEAKDIWGTSVVTNINWTLDGDDVAELSSKTSQTGRAVTVKLTEDAKDGDTFTLTAAAGEVKSKPLTITVRQGTVTATPVAYKGEYNGKVYISIKDIDRANSYKDLYLKDVLPQEVEVTYKDSADAKEYGTVFSLDWGSYKKLWNTFEDLRDNWDKKADRNGEYSFDANGYVKAYVGDKPVDIDLSGWLKIIVEENGADNWYEEPSAYVPPVPSANFTDVAAGYWAAEDINWCYAKKVMLGNSETTFNPAGVTSRQQLWMVLARVNGSAPDSMATARTWSINMGVSDGSNVSGALTRQQMVTMLYRYSSIKGYAGKAGAGLGGFTDAGSVGAYAQEAMSWAVANGIITGNNGRLNPNGTATRAQFAAIMHRFCDTFKVI